MENIVTIDEAKKLKKLGFAEKTNNYYYISNVDDSIQFNTSVRYTDWNFDELKAFRRKDRVWSAPTIDQRDKFYQQKQFLPYDYKNQMEKVIRNGKVAVLISTGFGAGWYSWNLHQKLIFHPKLVDMVENGKQSQITQEWVLTELGLENVYCGGAPDLNIVWLDEGTHFKIDEYDGAESIIMLNDLDLIA